MKIEPWLKGDDAERIAHNAEWYLSTGKAESVEDAKWYARRDYSLHSRADFCDLPIGAEFSLKEYRAAYEKISDSQYYCDWGEHEGRTFRVKGRGLEVEGIRLPKIDRPYALHKKLNIPLSFAEQLVKWDEKFEAIHQAVQCK